MVSEIHHKNVVEAGAGPVSIKVFGVGGCGNNIVELLHDQAMAGCIFIQADTDAQGLSRSGCSNQFRFGGKITHALGAGGDIQLGRAAAQDDIEEFKRLCAHTDIVFLVLGLGGGTGTGAGPVFAQAAREMGALVLCVAALPFDFEGRPRAKQAECGLHALRMASDGVISFPNDRSKVLIDQDLNALDAFRLLNEILSENIRAIWRMLSRPGLMNVNFSNLKNVLQGKHSENWFATVKVSGGDKARRILEVLKQDPLMVGGCRLEQSSAVLVSLTGGTDLSMGTVNEVLEPLSRMCPDAHILVGVGFDSELQQGLELTLIATVAGGESYDLQPPTESDSDPEEPGFETHFFRPPPTQPSPGRFAAPPPDLSPDKKKELLSKQGGESLHFLKHPVKMHQTTLPLEIVSKGRFEKSQPTILNGEDLDIPTYIRKGIVLN